MQFTSPLTEAGSPPTERTELVELILNQAVAGSGTQGFSFHDVANHNSLWGRFSWDPNTDALGNYLEVTISWFNSLVNPLEVYFDSFYLNPTANTVNDTDYTAVRFPIRAPVMAITVNNFTATAGVLSYILFGSQRNIEKPWFSERQKGGVRLFNVTQATDKYLLTNNSAAARNMAVPLFAGECEIYAAAAGGLAGTVNVDVLLNAIPIPARLTRINLAAGATGIASYTAGNRPLVVSINNGSASVSVVVVGLEA